MRNAEATREKILKAAVVEFSARGISGARVDRIAQNAGCNKNLIYIYFGSKEKLFSITLEKTLTPVYREMNFTPEDLPGFAARVFDFAMANPQMMRLMAWLSLEGKPDRLPERTRIRNERISHLRNAQKNGRVNATFPPGFLFAATLALATAWSAASPFGASLDPESTRRPGVLRSKIAEAIGLLSGLKKPSR
jgi:AcrR family transcriptional regulator